MNSLAIVPNFKGQAFEQLRLQKSDFVQPNIKSPKKSFVKDNSGLILAGLACAAAIGFAIASGRSSKVTTVAKYDDNLFSFKELTQRLLNSGKTTTHDITQNCINENLIGTGADSKVFKFSDPILDNWVIKVNVKHGGLNNSQYYGLTQVDDEFLGLNMGQAVGEIGPHIQILKKIDGIPHSLKDWSAHKAANAPITPTQAGDFLVSLKRIAQFPQETFDEYARRLKLLEDKGYKADSFNPNNYLVDYKSKQIYIIDAYKYEPDAHQNSRFDLICPLLDYPNFTKYYDAMSPHQQREFASCAHTIAAKCTTGACNAGVNTQESIFIEFIQKIDTRENTANAYYQCYDDMKKVIGNF